MTAYEIICSIVQTLGFLILAIMIYSIKAKEHADEEERKRASDYKFANWRYENMERIYKREAEEYSHWYHFGLRYGCQSPEEMRSLIDDLVKKINKLETKL